MRASELFVVSAIVLTSVGAQASVVTRVSVTSTGAQATGNSVYPAVSADGRHITFISFAPDLSPDDGDIKPDVYVHDRFAHTTLLVSKSTAGVKGNEQSGDPATYGKGGPDISGTGRYVAFTSFANNLVPGDTNNAFDIFVRDRDADGNGVFDEPGTSTTTRVSVSSTDAEANGHSQFPAISLDGRFVAFGSTAPNLVAGDTNGKRDVFVRDRDADGNGIFDEPGTCTTTRVSIGPGGIEGDDNSGHRDIQMSGDGRYIGFLSDANNLLPEDTNTVADVFVYDRNTGTLKLADVSSTGAPSNYYPVYDFSLSGDGRYVAFSQQDMRLVTPDAGYGGVADQSSDVLVHDMLTGQTTTWARNAPAGRRPRDNSDRPAISYDGSLIAFVTRFGHADFTGGVERNRLEVYLHDRNSGTTATQPMDASDGTASTVLARGLTLSSNGLVVAFDTEGQITAGDTNGTRDVFVQSCPVVVGSDPRFSSCDPIPYPTLSASERAAFEAGREEFEDVDTPEDGLGPVFNEASCAACHNRPWIGGTGDRRVTRIGTDGPGGFDPLPGHGGSVIQTQGIATDECTVSGETVPAEATIVTERDPPSLLAAGLIDAIDERSILRLADPNDRNNDGISGRANMDGARVGRFGRKAQIATLRAFAGDAYLSEMGITSPDFPTDLAPQGVPSCDPTPDPEDDGTNIAHFVNFLSVLGPIPPGRYLSNDVKRDATSGRRIFKRLGCRSCHSDRLRPPKSVVSAHGLRKVTLYTDLLLHDMGPDLADGIVQGDATGSEFRTAPLAGVTFSAPYLHDGSAPTLDAAIQAHGGEGANARNLFNALSPAERSQLRAFLESL